MLKDHKHIIYLGVLKQLLGGHRFRCSEEVEMLVNARALFLPWSYVKLVLRQDKCIIVVCEYAEKYFTWII